MSDSYGWDEKPSSGDDGGFPEKMEKRRKSVDLLGVSAAQFASAMTKAFSQATTGGKQFDDVLRNMALKLSSMAVTNAFKPIAKSFSKGFGNIFKDMFNGTSSSDSGDATTSGTAASSLAFFAKGGIKPFASGGVISAPSYFPVAGGLGLASEAGPEAIMPLSRGSDGKLGVAMSGGAPSNITVQIMTPDLGSFQRSESYLTGQIARAVLRGQRSL